MVRRADFVSSVRYSGKGKRVKCRELDGRIEICDYLRAFRTASGGEQPQRQRHGQECAVHRMSPLCTLYNAMLLKPGLQSFPTIFRLFFPVAWPIVRVEPMRSIRIDHDLRGATSYFQRLSHLFN